MLSLEGEYFSVEGENIFLEGENFCWGGKIPRRPPLCMKPWLRI